MGLSETPPDHLPRLPAGAYQGRAVIHWTFTMDKRAVGWLDAAFHSAFRWNLLHTCVRYGLACPLYCLMPDHLHLLLAGQTPTADQRLACRFLRGQLGKGLSERGFCFQKQAYDHVLRDRETERGAFESAAWYVSENPVRARLVACREEWPYTGAVVLGYPDVSPWQPGYWEWYWRTTLKLPGKGEGEA